MNIKEKKLFKFGAGLAVVAVVVLPIFSARAGVFPKGSVVPTSTPLQPAPKETHIDYSGNINRITNPELAPETARNMAEENAYEYPVESPGFSFGERGKPDGKFNWTWLFFILAGAAGAGAVLVKFFRRSLQNGKE